ncbi:hypothetical protein ES703_59275 [subsurface metagenome]
MTGLQRLTHHCDIAGAVKGVVGPADLVGARFRHVDEVRDEVLADVFRVDEVGHAESLAPRLALGVDIDADDHVGAGEPEPLDHVEADAAEPEHDRFRALLDLGRVDHRADACRDAAADVADLVERRVLADFCDRYLRQHGEVRKGRGAHVVMDGLAADREARGAVGHHALALRRADRGAEVGLARQARRALPAFRRVERNDVVAFLDAGDALADIDNDAGAFMAEDCRKQAFGISAGEGELVGVTDAGRLDLDHHLPMFRSVQVDLDNLEGFPAFKGNCCTRLHRSIPSFLSGSVRPAIRLGGRLPRLGKPLRIGVVCTRW